MVVKIEKHGQMGKYFLKIIQGFRYSDSTTALDFEINTKGAQETAEAIYKHVLAPMGW